MNSILDNYRADPNQINNLSAIKLSQNSLTLSLKKLES